MKTVISPIALIVAVALIIVIPVFSRAQSSPPASGSQAQGEAAKNPATNPGTAQLATGDPLEGGKEALKKGDFAGAQKFFSAYLVDHPWNLEALYFKGDAALELKQYDEAARNYREVIKQQPSAWGAHKNLVILYVAQGKWTEFDQERALLQEARAKGAPGLSAKDADIIDVLYVCPSPCDAKVQDKGTEQYRVIGYAELTGQYKMKYNFVHYGTDGKPDRWIACESEDVDQGFLAQRHPKEAAAGKRSYSLDSYTAPAANGKGGVTVQHGTIKFYHDGEPTYQTVRADVLAVLENKIKPISQSQSTVPERKPKQKQ